MSFTMRLVLIRLKTRELGLNEPKALYDAI